MDKHLNTYVHKILEFLKTFDTAVDFKTIEENIRINILKNPALLKVLKANPKIVVKSNSIRYVPTFSIRSVHDLEEILKKVNGKEGIEMSKIEDSPICVKGFIEDLKRQNKIIIIKDMDNSEVVFYNESEFPKIDDEIKAMWNAIKVPNHYDIAKELGDSGLKTAENRTIKKIKVATKIQSRSKRRINITNKHVKGLDLTGLDDSDSM